MSIVVNGTTIKTLNVNGTNMKEGYAQGVKVFASEQTVYPGREVTSYLTQRNITQSNFGLSTPGYAEGYGMLYIKVNLTGWKQIRITGKLNNYTGVYLSKNLPSKTVNPGCLALALGGAFGDYKYSNVWNVHNDSQDYTSSAQTFDEPINVENLTGDYYIVISLYGSNVTWGGQFVNVTKVVLS